MNTRNIANRLFKSVKEAREERRRVARKVVAEWEEVFDTAFLGNIDDSQHIQVLIDALVRREEE